MNAVLYDGKPEDRKRIREERIAPMTFNVVLTHYDMILRDTKALAKISWEYVIVDEGHRLKNKDSKLAETMRSLYSSRFRLLLTGTPIQNNLKELWSLLNFVLPKVFNSSQSFNEWFAAPFKTGMDDVQLTDEESLLIIHRLHQVIRPFLLRRKKQEVEKELPDKDHRTLKCDMSAWQKRYYRSVTEKGKVAMEHGSKGRALMNSAMQLRKVCIHPYLFLDNQWLDPEDPAELGPHQTSVGELEKEAVDFLVLAGRNFRAVLELDPNESTALVNWGRALCERARILANHDPSQAQLLYGSAIEKFDGALAAAPESFGALLGWGRALLELSDLQDEEEAAAAEEEVAPSPEPPAPRAGGRSDSGAGWRWWGGRARPRLMARPLEGG